MNLEWWDVEIPGVSERSRLHSLLPQGLGTPLTEAMTSYIMRLAYSHNLTTRKLILSEFLPSLDKAYLSQAPGGFIWRKLGAINGTGEWTEDFVRVAAQLTGRSVHELSTMTMLSYRHLLSSRGLLRSTRAWCSYCLAEWRTAGSAGYEPLLWSLQVVTTCPIHDRPLVAACPHADCTAQQPFIRPNGLSGYCFSCSRWLAAPTDIVKPDDKYVGLSMHQTHAVAVGTLIAGVSLANYSKPDKEGLERALQHGLEKQASGDRREFARLLGISVRSVSDLLTGNQVPQLGTLLQICERLNLSPLQILGLSDESAATHWHLSDPLQHNQVPNRRRPGTKKKVRPFDSDRLRRELEGVLNSAEEPPPSMRAVGERLGYDQSHLHKHFPTLCQAISARYKDYLAHNKQKRRDRTRVAVKSAVYKLVRDGHYPSYRRVKKGLPKERLMFEPDALRTWHEILSELGWPTKDRE